MTRLACLRVTVFAGALLTALAARPALASNAVGVYVAVSRVDMMPDATTATSVVIHGAFTLLRADGSYSSPQCGQMYFQCPAGSETMCRMQWQDVGRLGTMTGVCAGFGAMNMVSTATIRLEGSALAGPDTWDLGIGVSSARPSADSARPRRLCRVRLSSGGGGAGGGAGGATGGGAGGTGARRRDRDRRHGRNNRHRRHCRYGRHGWTVAGAAPATTGAGTRRRQPPGARVAFRLRDRRRRVGARRMGRDGRFRA